jgi:REP element-mobilizing transposase RayT
MRAAGRLRVHEIIRGEMNLSQDGLVVRRVWGRLPSLFDGICLDAFVIMPNHVHGIIMLSHPLGVRVLRPEDLPKGIGAGLVAPEGPSKDVGAGLAPPENPPKGTGAASRAPTLATVVGAFKSISAIEASRVLARVGRGLWQRGYYEHIIRSDEDLDRVHAYIQANPLRWADDLKYPAHGQGPRRG